MFDLINWLTSRSGAFVHSLSCSCSFAHIWAHTQFVPL